MNIFKQSASSSLALYKKLFSNIVIFLLLYVMRRFFFLYEPQYQPLPLYFKLTKAYIMLIMVENRTRDLLNKKYCLLRLRYKIYSRFIMRQRFLFRLFWDEGLIFIDYEVMIADSEYVVNMKTITWTTPSANGYRTKSWLGESMQEAPRSICYNLHWS